jgi:hypothetical protein
LIWEQPHSHSSRLVQLWFTFGEVINDRNRLSLRNVRFLSYEHWIFATHEPKSAARFSSWSIQNGRPYMNRYVARSRFLRETLVYFLDGARDQVNERVSVFWLLIRTCVCG